MEVKTEIVAVEVNESPGVLGSLDNKNDAPKGNQENHGKEPVRIGPHKYGCPFCSKIMRSAAEIKRHILVHTKEKPYQCHICDYKSTQKGHVKSHIKAAHISQ